jgi:SAM-dependent methyltransferase|tara:strand:- start:1869 stop:2435 length:567 start_codon:yes stop_codon:yes gene_type:complete
MHDAQQIFTSQVKKTFPKSFIGVKVLDVGSYDINGNNKYLFEKCDYTGVDIIDGKNVDIVSKGHEYDGESESFDTVISTECFEHDMYYEKTLKNIIRMLKPGGLFIFSCAAPGRPEHGTLRTTPQDSGVTLTNNKNDPDWGKWQNYYKNLTEDDIKKSIDINVFGQHQFYYAPAPIADLYFWGKKNGK